jgi:arsenate reductase (glutaredoxin)
MIHMWGLKNCDTCRSARRWLETHDFTFTFHDVRDDTPDAARISRWLEAVGIGVLLNRRGTTWRGLTESAKRKFEAGGDVVRALEAHPALLKRPVLEHGKEVLVGFDATRYIGLAGKSR